MAEKQIMQGFDITNSTKENPQFSANVCIHLKNTKQEQSF
jgi:ferritin-like metal-binding protein YciE